MPGYFLETIYRAETVTNCRNLRRLVCARFDAQEVGGLVSVFNQETRPIDDDPDYKWSGGDTFSLY